MKPARQFDTTVRSLHFSLKALRAPECAARRVETRRPHNNPGSVRHKARIVCASIGASRSPGRRLRVDMETSSRGRTVAVSSRTTLRLEIILRRPIRRSPRALSVEECRLPMSHRADADLDRAVRLHDATRRPRYHRASALKAPSDAFMRGHGCTWSACGVHCFASALAESGQSRSPLIVHGTSRGSRA